MTQKTMVVGLNDKPEFQRLLAGQPQTCGMKAGRVYLALGKDCGKHSTNEREEILVFLSGKGCAVIGETEEKTQVGQGKIAYIPPETEHNIINTGSHPLIYIYCVAPVNTDK